jgi:hypothetical protein
VHVNSSISNFKKALLLTLVLFFSAQWVCLKVSDISQEGSKQVVKEKRNWARTKGMFKKEPGKELVLVFGNSMIGGGVIPEVFDQENNHTTQTYNMALIALQTAPHYFLLKDFLKHNDAPDWILLQYSQGGFDVQSFPSFALQGAGFVEVINYAYLRGNADIFLNYVIPSRLHWPEVSRYIFAKGLRHLPENLKAKHRDLYLNSSDGNAIYGHNRKHFYESQFVFPEKYRNDIMAGIKRDRGYYFIAEQAAEGGVISPEYLVHMREELKRGQVQEIEKVAKPKKTKVELKIPLIENIFKLAKQYGIKVMILPEYELSETGKDMPTPFPGAYLTDELKDFQRRYGNVYLPPPEKDVFLLRYAFFSDPAHLNAQGGTHYTKIVASLFKQARQALKD